MDIALLAAYGDLNLGLETTELIRRGLEDELGDPRPRVERTTIGGALQVGWSLAILDRMPWGGVDASELLIEFDDLAARTLASSDRPPLGAHTESGAAAGYLLERCEADASLDDGWATMLVDRLEQCALYEPDGIAFVTQPRWLAPLVRPRHPRGRCDLGMAAGAAGAAALLSTSVERGHRTRRATELLEGLLRWLIGQAQQYTSMPAWVDLPGQPSTGPTSLGWCSGTVGVLVGIARAARALNDTQQREWALSRVEHVLATPLAMSSLDGSLCHGPAGIAHTINHLAQTTPRPSLLPLARAWIHRCRAAFHAAIESNPQLHPDMQGSLGMAFVILSAGSNRWPVWDHRLLIG